MRPLSSRMLPNERAVVAASGFTSLWALGWLSAEAAAASTAVAGGFAVGGVMAGSGLTVLWWKAQTLRELRHEHERAEEKRAEEEGTPL